MAIDLKATEVIPPRKWGNEPYIFRLAEDSVAEAADLICGAKVRVVAGDEVFEGAFGDIDDHGVIQLLRSSTK